MRFSCYTIHCVPERKQKGATDEKYDAGGQVFDEGEGGVSRIEGPSQVERYHRSEITPQRLRTKDRKKGRSGFRMG